MLRGISVLAGVAAAAALPLAAQAAGIGAKYGAHDPRTCASRTQPVKGPISAALAKQYFICDSEKLNGVWNPPTLSLVSNVTIQVGNGRKFDILSDATGQNNDDGIDPHFTVYPIRGSFISYFCSPMNSIGSSPGHNCIRQAMPHATGICFKSSFNEWHCHMQDISQPSEPHMPPPTGG